MRSLFHFGLFWGLCIFLHGNLANFTYKNGLSINLLQSPPLYDIVQVNFPNLQEYRIIPEILHIIPVITLAFYCVWYKNVVCFKKFLVNHGLLMLLRAVLFTVTLLPDSSRMCEISSHIGSCFDLLFSGHSTIMLLCSLLLDSNFKIPLPLKIVMYSITTITSFLIILCRNHYTIDIIVSFLLTYSVFKIF